MTRDLSDIGGRILAADFYNSFVINILESLRESIKPELLEKLDEVLSDAKTVQEELKLAAEEVLLLEIIPGDEK